MTDGIIKGDGTSRYLKGPADAATKYPTFEAFRNAWMAGTLTTDLNGINASGWQTQGTALNKANLLTDATATAMGLTAAATPNQAFDKLRQLTATAQSTADKPDIWSTTERVVGDFFGATLYEKAWKFNPSAQSQTIALPSGIKAIVYATGGARGSGSLYPSKQDTSIMSGAGASGYGIGGYGSGADFMSWDPSYTNITTHWYSDALPDKAWIKIRYIKTNL